MAAYSVTFCSFEPSNSLVGSCRLLFSAQAIGRFFSEVTQAGLYRSTRPHLGFAKCRTGCRCQGATERQLPALGSGAGQTVRRTFLGLNKKVNSGIPELAVYRLG